MKTILQPLARAACALLLPTLMCGSALAAPGLPTPPAAVIRDVVQTLHGVEVHDPYRYMEDAKDAEVRNWLRVQAEHARQTLERIPGRDEMERRITELSALSGDRVESIVRMPGDRIFYLKRGRDEQQFKLVLRVGLQGAERVLVDPQQETDRTGVPHAINYFVPSWDGAHVAYGLSEGGSEDASLFILNVRSARHVGQPIARVPEALVSWLPDSQSLTYNQLKQRKAGDAETETYMDSRVMWLRLGDGEALALPVFGPTVSRGLGLGRLEVGGITFTPGSRWMVARTTDSTVPEGSLFVALVSDIVLPSIPWRRLSRFEDSIVDIELRGTELFYRTHLNAPQYKLMKLDLRWPDLALAREVALAPKGGVIEGFALTRNAVLATVREGASIGLRRYALNDKLGVPMQLPFAGAASLHEDPAHAYEDALYTLSGWDQLPRVFQLRGAVSVDSGLRPASSLPSLGEVEIANVQVRSHDGALVPLTLLHRKGLKRDGSNPTLLSGYGAYGYSETADFSPAHLAWIERGGVLALANVRGSGVYGKDWHLAGFKATKSNTWKDGIACAQYLIDQGWASARTLSVSGASAGGIFAGRLVTEAPQLFAAAVINAGTLDTVRAEESANGVTNVSEFGTVRDPGDFPSLLDMSSYHHIVDAKAYPGVLLLHGMNDPRVDLWQSAKTAARLQAASASGKPVLLRLDTEAGHGLGSTSAQHDAIAADSFSFLLWQMGKTGELNPPPD